MNSPLPRDPSLPPVPLPALGLTLPEDEYCDCERPVPRERANRRGASRTYCQRCNRQLPIRIAYPARKQPEQVPA